MTRPLTASERQTLDWLRAYVAEHGFSPSYAELAAGLGMRSKSGVHYRLECLAGLGLIRHKPFTPRAIQLLDTGTTTEGTAA